MTATYSPETLPFRNGLRVIRQNRKMNIVTCILQILGVPLIMLALIGSFVLEDRHIYIGVEAYAGIGAMCLGVSVFMGMFAAINSFSELWKKTNVDMLYSLPLTGTQRYFTNFLGGLAMYTVPYIAACILGWIILLVGGMFVSPEGAADVAELRSIYAYGTAGLFVLMVLYYALSVLITVCCGTLFESLYTTLFLNCLIPGTVAAVICVVCYKVSLDMEAALEVIGFMSPIGGLIYLGSMISDKFDSGMYGYAFATQTNTHEMLPTFLRWIVAICLLAAVLTLAGWLLYKRRKAEHVGKPFVYLAAYYLMLTMVTILIMCLMPLSDDVIGGAILFSAIVYFVMEVIRKRGFRKFWVSIVTYVVTVAAAAGCYGVIVATGCFGRVNYVPASASVTSVKIQLDRSSYVGGNTQLEYTDREIISGMTAIHRDIVAARKDGADPCEPINAALAERALWDLRFDEYNGFSYEMPSVYREDLATGDSYQYNSTYTPPSFPLPEGAHAQYVNSELHSLNVTYYTVAGTQIHRNYMLTPDEYLRVCGLVQGTPLYAEGLYNGLYADLERYRLYSPDGTELNEEGKQNAPLRLRLSLGSDYRYDYSYSADESAQEITVRGGMGTIREFTDAYRADLERMTEEDYRTQRIYAYVYSYPIYDCCTATLEKLDSYGFRKFTPEERVGMRSVYYYDEDSSSMTYSSVTGIQVYAPGTWSAASLDYPSSTLTTIYYEKDKAAYTDYYVGVSGQNTKASYPELEALMDVAVTNYASAEDCYLLVVAESDYGYVNSFVIPPEKSDLAEAVIAKGDNYYQYGLWNDFFEGNTQSAPFYPGNGAMSY